MLDKLECADLIDAVDRRHDPTQRAANVLPVTLALDTADEISISLTLGGEAFALISSSASSAERRSARRRSRRGRTTRGAQSRSGASSGARREGALASRGSTPTLPSQFARGRDENRSGGSIERTHHECAVRSLICPVQHSCGYDLEKRSWRNPDRSALGQALAAYTHLHPARTPDRQLRYWRDPRRTVKATPTTQGPGRAAPKGALAPTTTTEDPYAGLAGLDSTPAQTLRDGRAQARGHCGAVSSPSSARLHERLPLVTKWCRGIQAAHVAGV